MIILDTHVLLWSTQEPKKLGANCRKFIEEHWKQQQVAVSVISFWECQMLQNKGRIQMSSSVSIWRNQLLDRGLIEIPLLGETSILSAHLDLHGDPADRMIVATALKAQATLITADLKILAWQNKLPRYNAKE